MATYTPGIDISHHQGLFGWEAWIAKHSLGFAFVKASEGLHTGDAQFARNWRKLRELGITRGAYHFPHPDQNPTAEADHFLAAVHAVEAARPGVDLLCLDHENAATGASPAHAAAWARTWLARVEDQTGIRPVLYTYLDYAHHGFCDGLGDWPLWIADPSSTKAPRVPKPWTSWVMWQTGERGVDFDQFHGTPAQLTAFAASTNLRAHHAPAKTPTRTAPPRTPAHPPAPARKPVVSLAVVRRAANTHGRHDQVLLIQKALAVEMGLNYSSGPGVFGPHTKAAYAAWQRHRGFTGRQANGIPGLKTLTQLGQRHGFTVTA